jgi:hypothetical protein
MTTINTSIEINQNFIDSTLGPYIVEGGSIETPIIIKFIENIKINSSEIFFIIKSDYVTIDGDYNEIYFDNLPLYSGLVKNSDYSNILITSLIIDGNNSFLKEESGWFIGKDFGVNSFNNKIQECSNYLPITFFSGGIVGNNSKIDVEYCENDGDIGNFSGGIYGTNCSGNCIYAYNYGVMIGYLCGGICSSANELNISYCENYGIIKETAIDCSGIIVALEGLSLNIKECNNYSDILGIGSGIINAVYKGLNTKKQSINIEGCKNYGNILGPFCAGIVRRTRVYLNIKECENYGKIQVRKFKNLSFFINY